MTLKIQTINEHATSLEKQEMAYWSEHYRDVPGALKNQLGIALLDRDNVKAGSVAGVDTLAFNRAIGLGIERAADEAQIDEIVDFYRRTGTRRFFIQLSPGAEPDNLGSLLTEKGLNHYNNWAKLVRPIGPVPVAESPFSIEEIGPERAATFADIIVSVFEWDEKLKPVVALPVGRPGWKHYLAYDRGKPVACAALYVRGEYATLAFAATLPAYRGCGAQSALIARRFQDAREAGCRWMTSETAEDLPERPVTSFRNMKRLGFEIAYARPNYLYEF